MSPTFSVIVPTYDRPDYVHDAVASVLQQTVRDFEVLVVDDASPRLPLLPDDPRVRLVRRQRNGGAAASRNTGAAHATGRYLTFLDDDDRWHPERLALALDGLRRAPLALCWTRFDDEAPRPKRLLEGDIHDVVLDDIAPHLGSVAMDRERFVPFDERYKGPEDLEWWLRVSRGITVTTVASFGNVMRRHPGVRHENGPRSRIEWNRRLLDEHADYFGTHPRAAAFRWLRIGLTARSIGDRAVERDALLRSMRIRPTWRAGAHLVRSYTTMSARRRGVASAKAATSS